MFLQQLPGFTVIPGVDGGLVAQVCAGMSRAAQFGRPHILYTEPDKGDFFDARLSTFVGAAPDASGNAGVVIPARDEASFRTYPAIQQRAERIINSLWGDVIGIEGITRTALFSCRPRCCATSRTWGRRWAGDGAIGSS
jgi:hypothetical protein